jgi:hypothetical protein
MCRHRDTPELDQSTGVCGAARATVNAAGEKYPIGALETFNIGNI